MSSKVITYDMLQKIVNDNSDLSKRFKELSQESTHTSINFNSFKFDNSDYQSFKILPIPTPNQEYPYKVELKFGTTDAKISNISFNDNILIKNGAIYLKQPESTNKKPINIIQTKRIIEIIQTLEIELNSDDSLSIHDNYYFFSESSNKEVFINQNQLLLSLIVFTKNINKRLTIQEAYTDPQCLELSNLRDDFNQALQGIDVSNQKNKSDISLIKNTLKTIISSYNEMTDSCTFTIETAEEKFINMHNGIKQEILAFNQRFEDFKVNHTEISKTMNEIQSKQTKLNESFHNDHQNLSILENTMKNEQSEIKSLKEKMVMMNSSIINHGSKLGVLVNIEKIVDNKIKQMESNIKNESVDMNIKFEKYSKNLVDDIFNTNQKIKNYDNTVNIIQEKFEKVLIDFESKTYNITTKFQKLDEYVKNCMITLNNKTSQIENNIKSQNKTSKNALQINNDTIQNTQSEIQTIKSNVFKLKVLEQKIEQLDMSNQKHLNQIFSLNTIIESKNQTIDYLQTQIDRLNGQFLEFKTLLDDEKGFRSEIQLATSRSKTLRNTKKNNSTSYIAHATKAKPKSIEKIKIPTNLDSDSDIEKKNITNIHKTQVSDNKHDLIPHPVAPGFATSTPTKSDIDKFTSGSESDTSIKRKSLVANTSKNN